MKTFFYTVQSYDQAFLEHANEALPLDHKAIDCNIDDSNIHLAEGFDIVSIFGTDLITKEHMRSLKDYGIKAISIRAAGYNGVDLHAAKEHGIEVFNVPEYSPQAIAEHVIAMILNLSRRFHISYNHMREGNFSISSLLGFNLSNKVCGIVGAGKIGTALARILTGFNCEILAFDPYPNEECKKLGVKYVDLDTLLAKSDVISLNLPITEESHHMIDDKALSKMKKDVILINTGRGGLIDTEALIEHIKSGHVGHVGLDVYEWEKDYFHKDLSATIISDDQLARLLFFPNVIVTSHQAYFTRESLTEIWMISFKNIQEFMKKGTCSNRVQIP